jgi:DNA-binding YbaB/EbfC family protein
MRGPGGMDMNKLMKQAQKMQEAMLAMQEDLSNKTVEGTSGGGAVTVSVTGGMKLASVQIKPEAVDPEDIETLEDLVLSAVNNALEKANEMANSQMGSITGGMKLPGMGF